MNTALYPEPGYISGTVQTEIFGLKLMWPYIKNKQPNNIIKSPCSHQDVLAGWTITPASIAKWPPVAI